MHTEENIPSQWINKTHRALHHLRVGKYGTKGGCGRGKEKLPRNRGIM